MMKKLFLSIAGILITGMLLLIFSGIATQEKNADEKKIRTDTGPVYNHFPDFPAAESIQWCSETSKGIGLTTVRIYVFAFFDSNVSERFGEWENLNKIPDFYFLPDNLIEDNTGWRKLACMEFAFQSGIKDSEKMVTSVYLNETGNVIYMEAVGD